MENEWVCGERTHQIAGRMQHGGSNDACWGLDWNEAKGEFKRQANKFLMKHVHGMESGQWSKERKNRVKQHLSTLENLHLICSWRYGHLLWRYSRPIWTRSCAACCRRPCFIRGVGL